MMTAKVLLVDDDELNRFVGQELLESLGMESIVAGSGAEALDKLQSCRFDLVLMDISMQVMDGYETTRLIRAQIQFKCLPIIALTAHALVNERAKCLQVGMDDYLAKAFTLAELKQVIHKWTGVAFSV